MNSFSSVLTPAGRRHVFIAAVAANVANVVSYQIITPNLPTIGADLRLRPDTLGLIYGIGPWISGTLQIPTAIVADRWGRRRVIIAGNCLVIAASLLRWQSSEAWTFALGQVAFGLAGGCLIAGSSAVAYAYPPDKRTRMLGLLLMMNNVAQIAGSLAGGFLAPLVGWRLVALATVFLPVSLTLPAISMQEGPHDGRSVVLNGGLRGQAAFLSSRTMLALAAFTFAGSCALAGCLYLLPFLARTRGLGASGAAILMIPYVLGAMIGGPGSGLLGDWLGLRRPLVGVMALTLIAAIFLAAVPLGPVGIGACFLCLGVGATTLTTFATSLAAELATRRGFGVAAAMAAPRLTQGVATAVAPAVWGGAFVQAGSLGAFGVSAIALLIAIGFAFPATSSPSHMSEDVDVLVAEAGGSVP